MLDINLTPDVTDDRPFVETVAQIIRGATVTHRPTDFYIFKIDHWFDHQWLQFSGKIQGAAGTWRRQLTIPPFVSNRIVTQSHYIHDEVTGTYHFEASGQEIHHRGPSSENLTRVIKSIAPNSALFWYSGGTTISGRGSLMGYIPVGGEHWPWFLTFTRNGDWRVARRKQIHEYEVLMFLEAGRKVFSDASCE